MSITKISSLFAANADQVPAVTPSQSVSPQATQPQGAPPGGSDAVVFASTLQASNRVPLGDSETARAARVQKLTEDVRGGHYRPDRAKVAVAVLRDLA